MISVGVSLSVWVPQPQIASVACGPHVFTCNVVVVHHFVILLCERLSADLARCCRIVASHFVVDQCFHTLLVGYNSTNYEAFVYHVLVKFIHNVWTGVDRGFRLICFVLRDTIAGKSTNVMDIYKLICLDGIDIIVVVCRGKE